MSNKATCPSCGAHTSGVWAAMRWDDPCPECGFHPDPAPTNAERLGVPVPEGLTWEEADAWADGYRTALERQDDTPPRAW